MAFNSPRFTKRQKIVNSVIALTGLMALSLYFASNAWILLILIAGAYFATVYCLDNDLRQEEWVVFPLYILLLTVAAYTWAAQFLQSWPAILAGSVGYGLAMYGLLLTLNILNIATIRTLPLSRAASTVLSMAGLVLSFSLFYLTLINQPAVWNWMGFVASISFLIAWPLVWTSLTPKQRLVRSITWALLPALLIAQLAGIASFWPNSFMSSLFLAVELFLILGIIHLQEKKLLSQNTKKQYLMLGGVVAFVFYLLTQW